MKYTTIQTNTYMGLSVNQNYELYDSYLSKILNVLEGYSAKYARMMVLRVDLHLSDYQYIDNCLLFVKEDFISHFFKRLNALIKRDLNNRRTKGRVHASQLGYIWVREFGETGKPHYHVALLLNADSYYLPGDYSGERDDLAGMVIEAWGDAVNVDLQMARALVTFPDNPVHRLNVNGVHYVDDLNNLFHRLSYFAKVQSKNIEAACRSFGTSQILHR